MGVYSYLKGKQLHHWLGGYLKHASDRRRDPKAEGPRHVLFAFCDHWEPLWNEVSDEQGSLRVRAWAEGYPALAERYVDADGVHPQHSFFFPGEQYRPAWIDELAKLARRRLGEVELHLHHDGDSAETLTRDIRRYLADLARHGHLSRDADGRLRYGFIHGNWCLANSAADGRMCGVDEEIPLLFETGCYADFTFPAPESDAQPNIVNQIYWPIGDLARRRAYEHGERARVGETKRDRILMIEGPTALGLRAKKMPVRIDMGDVTAHDPPTPSRVKRWVDAGVSVVGRPEWIFVKVHTHGAPEDEAKSLLGEGGRALHDTLTGAYNDGTNHVLHYVTAREMFNVAIAAMDGKSGDPNDYRDYVLAPPPARQLRTTSAPVDEARP
jgi:hypothetical protein